MEFCKATTHVFHSDREIWWENTYIYSSRDLRKGWAPVIPFSVCKYNRAPLYLHTTDSAGKPFLDRRPIKNRLLEHFEYVIPGKSFTPARHTAYSRVLFCLYSFPFFFFESGRAIVKYPTTPLAILLVSITFRRCRFNGNAVGQNIVFIRKIGNSRDYLRIASPNVEIDICFQ